MSLSTQGNSPYLKRDANNNVIQNSAEDMTFRGEYDGSNNLIYKGFARPGAAEGALVWQVSKLTYDANGDILTVVWPQNSFLAASSEYMFAWSNRASYTYS